MAKTTITAPITHASAFAVNRSNRLDIVTPCMPIVRCVSGFQPGRFEGNAICPSESATTCVPSGSPGAPTMMIRLCQFDHSRTGGDRRTRTSVARKGQRVYSASQLPLCHVTELVRAVGVEPTNSRLSTCRIFLFSYARMVAPVGFEPTKHTRFELAAYAVLLRGRSIVGGRKRGRTAKTVRPTVFETVELADCAQSFRRYTPTAMSGNEGAIAIRIGTWCTFRVARRCSVSSGCQPWIQTTITGFKDRRPAVERGGNGARDGT